MSSFNHTETANNLLPYDGELLYYGKVLNHEQANVYLNSLLNTIEWKHDEAVIFGRHIITKRKVAWYADEGFAYTYSNITKHALSWTRELLEIKKLTEACSGISYNACLLNLYHDGNEGMSWHSDDEVMLEKDAAIASVSFGAERKFTMKHRKTKETLSLQLEHGSLLVMKGTTQTHWLHALPKSARIKTARINLTFRTMVKQY